MEAVLDWLSNDDSSDIPAAAPVVPLVAAVNRHPVPGVQAPEPSVVQPPPVVPAQPRPQRSMSIIDTRELYKYDITRPLAPLRMLRGPLIKHSRHVVCVFGSVTGESIGIDNRH